MFECIAISASVGLAERLLMKYGVEPTIGRKKFASKLQDLCRQAVEKIRGGGEYDDCFDRDQALVEPHLFKSAKPAWDQFIAAFLEGDVHTEPDWEKLYQAYKDEFANSANLLSKSASLSV